MNKDFILNKLALLKKDNQQTFSELAEPLVKMLENGEATKIVKVPNDNNWFKVSFDAVRVAEDRLVITAEREHSGVYDGAYVVDFKDTRAAYLQGYYEPRHRRYGFSYITWDVRAYANSLKDGSRVYVHGFRAHKEIEQMIKKMEQLYSTSNIVNKYINDNLTRVKHGIKCGRKPEQIEKNWSRGMMERLGYRHVELIDTGRPQGEWNNATSHWFKHHFDRVLEA